MEDVVEKTCDYQTVWDFNDYLEQATFGLREFKGLAHQADVLLVSVIEGSYSEPIAISVQHADIPQGIHHDTHLEYELLLCFLSRPPRQDSKFDRPDLEHRGWSAYTLVHNGRFCM